MTKKATPTPIIRRTIKGFALGDAYSAELVERDPVGTEYDLVKRSRRSLPQHRLYWQALSAIVRATEQWPTAEHLHSDIKLTLGYTRKSVNLRTGEVVLSVDSTGFDAMPSDEFKLFFDKAMKLISEQCGIDPLEFYGRAA